MAKKDITSKKLLKRIAAEMANLLLHLDIEPDSVELLETQHQRVEERRADLVFRTIQRGKAKKQIMHLEIQNDNQSTMPVRMMRYYTDIRLTYPNEPIQQYMIYIGRAKLNMLDYVSEAREDWKYQYHILDMRTVDCGLLLSQDKPEALVMAILCDFRGRPEKEVIFEIVSRLRLFFGENEKDFGDYFEMLEILSENRDLKKTLKESKKMITQVDVTKLASYEWGYEDATEKMEKIVQEKDEQLRLAAKKLLTMGTMDHKAIADLLGLSLEEIKKLAEKQHH